MRNILVTGGAGFIGSHYLDFVVNQYPEDRYIVLDKLTYAGNIKNIEHLMDRIVFIKGDICDYELVCSIFEKYNINGVVNFAAESHVDNSIKDPFIFMKTNIAGTNVLLEAARNYWGDNKNNKFVHISTDEVYGALGEDGKFSEQSQIMPSSPYSASKASSDLIALAYYKTYGMNVNVTNCSNNYGSMQHNEKLIPRMIMLAKKNEKLPVYGTGNNVRDWIYVEDHCRAIDMVFNKGKPGERYNIGSDAEMRNIDIVNLILDTLDKPKELISFVEDRKGHDFRYAIDASKITKELGWVPLTSFEDGIKQTIQFYNSNDFVEQL